jgi:predicted Fe-Mo cluster-binding NifX family protein
MKRILIPLNNNKLSEDFNQCSHYLVFEIYKNHISEKKYQPSDVLYKNDVLNWLIQHEISDVIANKIDYELTSSLANTKISLFVGIEIEKPEKLIENYLNGNLKSNTKLVVKKETVTNRIL